MFRIALLLAYKRRKKRQAYLCAFQQPNIVDKLGLGEVIRGQCQTVTYSLEIPNVRKKIMLTGS